jgi:D-alanyl-D-alanine carboxypeptidase
LPSGLIKYSTNLFLDSNYGTTAGIKTGNTDEAKFVFVTSIESEDKPTIISSVMQAPNRTVSQRQAIDNADALGKTYNEQEIFTENAPVLSTNLPWQKNVTIYTKEPVIIDNIANKTIKYSLQIDNFTKNTKASQKIGLLTAQSLIEQKSYDLYLSDDYTGVSPFWLLTNPLY